MLETSVAGATLSQDRPPPAQIAGLLRLLEDACLDLCRLSSAQLLLGKSISPDSEPDFLSSPDFACRQFNRAHLPPGPVLQEPELLGPYTPLALTSRDVLFYEHIPGLVYKLWEELSAAGVIIVSITSCPSF